MLLGILIVFDAYVSKRVKIRFIEVRGVRLLKRGDVVGALRGLRDKWIFMLQFCNVEKMLRERYGFLRVKVEAVWPDRVIVDVKEPSPAYVLVEGRKRWVVVSNFYVYPYRRSVSLKGLPLLCFSGFKRKGVERLPVRLMKVVDAYVRGLNRIGFRVRKVDVVSAAKLVFYTKRGLRFVSDATKRNIWKLNYIVDIMKKRRSRKAASVVDLRFGNSIVVR